MSPKDGPIQSRVCFPPLFSHGIAYLKRAEVNTAVLIGEVCLCIFNVNDAFSV